jgi:hypothetical protein
MDITTHPLAWRLPASSTNSLILWCLLYAQTHPDTITPQGMAKLANGDKYDRKARALLSLYGLGQA